MSTSALNQTADPAAFIVILVIASQARCGPVRALIGRLAPHSTVEATQSVLDAMLRCYRRPADLLLLDQGIDGAAAPALIRQLARIASRSVVLVFDDIDQPAPGVAYDVWPWSEAEVVLRRWLDARRTRAARHEPDPPAIESKEDDQ